MIIFLTLTGLSQLLLISIKISFNFKCKLEISEIFFFNIGYFKCEIFLGNLLNNFKIILKSCDVRSCATSTSFLIGPKFCL